MFCCLMYIFSEEGSCTIKPCVPFLLHGDVSQRQGEQLPVTGTSIASASDLGAVTAGPRTAASPPRSTRTKRRDLGGDADSPRVRAVGHGGGGPLWTAANETIHSTHAAERRGRGLQTPGRCRLHGTDGPRRGGRTHTRVFARVCTGVHAGVCA